MRVLWQIRGQLRYSTAGCYYNFKVSNDHSLEAHFEFVIPRKRLKMHAQNFKSERVIRYFVPNFAKYTINFFLKKCDRFSYSLVTLDISWGSFINVL